jgi:hypothetical protein
MTTGGKVRRVRAKMHDLLEYATRKRKEIAATCARTTVDYPWHRVPDSEARPILQHLFTLPVDEALGRFDHRLRRTLWYVVRIGTRWYCAGPFYHEAMAVKPHVIVQENGARWFSPSCAVARRRVDCIENALAIDDSGGSR